MGLMAWIITYELRNNHEGMDPCFLEFSPFQIIFFNLYVAMHFRLTPVFDESGLFALKLDGHCCTNGYIVPNMLYFFSFHKKSSSFFQWFFQFSLVFLVLIANLEKIRIPWPKYFQIVHIVSIHKIGAKKYNQEISSCSPNWTLNFPSCCIFGLIIFFVLVVGGIIDPVLEQKTNSVAISFLGFNWIFWTIHSFSCGLDARPAPRLLAGLTADMALARGPCREVRPARLATWLPLLIRFPWALPTTIHRSNAITWSAPNTNHSTAVKILTFVLTLGFWELWFYLHLIEHALHSPHSSHEKSLVVGPIGAI